MKFSTKIAVKLGRHAARFAAVSALAISATLTFAAPAQADLAYHGQLSNEATGRCLDDSFSYGLRTIPCNGSSYQHWYVYESYYDSFILKNVATERCLDDSAYGLRTFACNETEYQRWWHYGVNGGWAGTNRFRNVSNNKCLDDSNSYGIRTYPCNGSIYQAFQAS